MERALDAELLQIYPTLPIEILQLRTVDGVTPLAHARRRGHAALAAILAAAGG